MLGGPRTRPNHPGVLLGMVEVEVWVHVEEVEDRIEGVQSHPLEDQVEGVQSHPLAIEVEEGTM